MRPHCITLAAALALCLWAGCATRPSAAIRANQITLWNGIDLTGWKLVLKNSSASSIAPWDANGGVLRLLLFVRPLRVPRV